MKLKSKEEIIEILIENDFVEENGKFKNKKLGYILA